MSSDLRISGRGGLGWSVPGLRLDAEGIGSAGGCEELGNAGPGKRRPR